MTRHKVDAKGLQCPAPIVEVFKTARKAASGDQIVVEATDKGFEKDIEAWCKKTGNKLVKQTTRGTTFVALIEKS